MPSTNLGVSKRCVCLTELCHHSGAEVWDCTELRAWSTMANAINTSLPTPLQSHHKGESSGRFFEVGICGVVLDVLIALVTVVPDDLFIVHDLVGGSR